MQPTDFVFAGSLLKIGGRPRTVESVLERNADTDESFAECRLRFSTTDTTTKDVRPVKLYDLEFSEEWEFEDDTITKIVKTLVEHEERLEEHDRDLDNLEEDPNYVVPDHYTEEEEEERPDDDNRQTRSWLGASLAFMWNALATALLARFVYDRYG